MAKREQIQVDEDKIKRMIAGDIPLRTSPVVERQPTTEPETNRDEDILENSSVKIPKRRKGKFDYQEIFLSNQKITRRRQTTLQLSDDVLKSIQKILTTTDGLSMVVFINNILAHHFEEYAEPIEEIQRKYIDELFKS